MSEDISLAELCKRQGGEYIDLCYATNHPGMVNETFESAQLVRVDGMLVYCGVARDVHIFGSTYIYSKDPSAVVFRGQTQQSLPERGRLKENFAQHIQTRSDLFSAYMPDECIFIGGTWTTTTDEAPNFGHLIYEFLVRLAIFDIAGVLRRDMPGVVYDNMPLRWLGFFELAGIPIARLIKVSVKTPPAYRKVWIASCPNTRDSLLNPRLWPAGLHWLRSRFLANAGHSKAPSPKRIYLGRGAAKWHRVQNESAVIDCLARYGFQSLEMSDMSAAEQVQAVRGAEIIIYATGATGVMTLFAPEHCIVIHAAPRGVGEGIWAAPASALVLRQAIDRIDCEAVESEQRRNTMAGVNELADFKIDLEVLAARVEKAEAWIRDRQIRDALAI